MRVALFCLFATGDFRLTDVFGSLAYNGDMAITQSSINLPLLMLQISGDKLAVDRNLHDLGRNHGIATTTYGSNPNEQRPVLCRAFFCLKLNCTYVVLTPIARHFV
jgi:hypothetical protein